MRHQYLNSSEVLPFLDVFHKSDIANDHSRTLSSYERSFVVYYCLGYGCVDVFLIRGIDTVYLIKGTREAPS